MLKNLVQHGRISETMKHGLLVLFVALISACGGGGGGGAISITPDGESSVTPTTIEGQLAAAEDELKRLPADEREAFKSRISELKDELAAKELSIEELRAQLMAAQEEMRNIIESSCANDQFYIDGSCKNCEAGTVFSFDDSTCIATELSCGAIEQVYADGVCKECEPGTAFSGNACVAAEESCENEQYYTDGSCKNCAPGMVFSFEESRCIATDSSCSQLGVSSTTIESQLASSDGRIYVAEGDSCVLSCPLGTVWKNDECILPELACANGQVDGNGNCINCPAGMELDYSGSVCIATELSCATIGQVYANGSCEKCPNGTAFGNNECFSTTLITVLITATTIVSCPDGHITDPSDDGGCIQVDTCADVVGPGVDITKVSISCLIGNCPAGTAVNILGECVAIVTPEQCHAQSQIHVIDFHRADFQYCKSCPADKQYYHNGRYGRCIPIPHPTSPTYDTAEYRKNLMYDHINPLYAYEQGYFGDGVTVAVVEYHTGYVYDHPDLAANYVIPYIPGIEYHDSHINSHAARVAGLIGGALDGVGMHGIAPGVEMLPFGAANAYYNTHGERALNLPVVAQYIRDNNIPIVNNSWGGITYLSVNEILNSGVLNHSAHEFYDYIHGTDSIWVWRAGNEGLNTESNARPSPNALYPFFLGGLEENWLVAIAVDENENIQSYSNACGWAFSYGCVAAAVYDAYTPGHVGYIRTDGDTSFAASQVSGALAILHGALGLESPQMAKAILLQTATDLGEPGVDDIYGHGLVNISAAIVKIENLETESTDELAAVSFANLRGELPSGFAHLHNELSAVQVAVKLDDGLYYNVALSETMTPGDDSDVPLGDGATDMLADAESDSRRGFFAYGDMDTELGLRYYGGGGGFSYVAEGQHAKTNQRYFSGNFGSLGGVSGKVYSGKVGFVRDMNMAGMQIFGDYERAAVGGDGDEGNLIVGVRDAQAESWMAGMSFGDIWKYGDKIKLSARQEMGLSDGDLIVRYPHAVGDFHETFIGEGTQEIEVREAFLPLKQKALMLYTAGYAQQFTAKSEWAAALEYNAGNNAKALSLIWQGEF